MAQTFEIPDGVHTIAMGVGDLNGILRGKRFPARHWQNIVAGGNAISVSTFAMDVLCDVWDTPYVNFDTGYPDMHIFPMTAPVETPWEPGVAICMARAEGMDHRPVPIDPRNALVRQVARAQAMGFEVQVGCELEFYLLDPETGQPRDVGNSCYGLDRAAELEPVLGPIRHGLEACGIEVEQSNPEYAPGQVEVNLRYCEALEAADRTVLFRSLVKQIAATQGFHATFMAKPFYETSGNGFHAHYSLWKDGENQMGQGGRLGDLGRHFLGGLQARMVEASICGAPTPNGYRRRQPLSFCPVNASWGFDNRTVALRVIEGTDSAVRVEKRDAGADANPYYVLAADIAAGLDGIEQGLEPGPESNGNAYEETGLTPLPGDIGAAIDLARGSGWLFEVLGQEACELYLQQAERERDAVAAQVTPVETERYLRSF